jgi:predicted dienelactone hydrolase
LWIDQKRQDPFTKDPQIRRHLIVRVWYPAQALPGAKTTPYILDVNEFSEKSEYRAFGNVKTNAVTDAPLAKSKTPFPVLIYQPGGGTQRFVATFETEQLASHGYVVVAADHPGFSDTVLFPDGSRFQPDQHLRPEPKGAFRQDVFDNWDWLNKDVFPSWTADGSYTIDKVEELNKAAGQIFYHRLDLSRIGVFGWSFGGATSVEMSIDDPRVKAIVDQDGQLFGSARTEGTARPMMLMHHGDKDTVDKPEQQPVLDELVAIVESWDRSLREHSTNDFYDVTIANTQHGNFSDFVLGRPPKAGELDPRRAHAIIIAYTEAFFDHYLRGENSDLLKAPSSSYPEVTFRRKTK